MNDLIHIAFDPAGVWHHSKFPSPFVTADYDAKDRLIGVTAAGPMAKKFDATVQEFVSSVIAEDLTDGD